MAGLVVAFVFGAGAIAWTVAHAKAAPRYPDFIAGYLAFGNHSKGEDLLAFPALAAAVVAGWLLYSACVRRLDRRAALPATRDALVTQVLLWAVPATITCAAAAFYIRFDAFMVLVSAAGIAGLLVASGRSSAETPQDIEATSLGILAGALVSLLPVEITLILGRLVDLPTDFWSYAGAISRWSLAPLMIAGGMVARTRTSTRRGQLAWALAVSQAGLLAFYFALLPATQIAPGGAAVPFKVSPLLWILAATLVVVGLADVAKRFRRADESTGITGLLSPFALFGLLVALCFGDTRVPWLHADDYHYGESLVGWWSLLDFGRLPYRDYIPPRGFLVDDFAGLVGRVFFDGTAASINEAFRLSLALTALPAFLALHWRTGSLVLAFVATLLFGSTTLNSPWQMLVPFACLMVRNVTTWRAVWLWAGAAILLVFAIPAQGIILVAATAPATALFLWSHREQLRTSWKRLAMMAAVVVAMVALTPLGTIAWGAIRYVIENGPVNQLAWGLPWSLGDGGDRRMAGLPFEVVRMSWMAVPLVALALAALHWREPDRRPWLWGVAAATILYSLLVMPYAMGRIDPFAVSRPGIFSSFAWLVLLPLVLLPFLDGKRFALMLLVTAAVSSAIGLAYIRRNILDVAARPTLNLPAVPVDGAAAGLPNVGRAIVDGGHWERLLRLNRALNELLPPGEPYLDMTNRSAQYFYVGRPPPIEVPAPFNMVAIGQQRRAVEALRRHTPRVALLEGKNVLFDNASQTLRTPLLMRFVMEAYEPQLRNGFVIGRLKSQGSGADRPARERRLPLRDFSDVNWERGVFRSQAALIIEHPDLASLVAVGESIRLPDGESRVVQRVWAEGSAIWLEGRPLAARAFEGRRYLSVTLDEQKWQEHALELWDRAFRIQDLGYTPVSWGQSWHSLETATVEQKSLEQLPRTIGDLESSGRQLAVRGPDPRIVIDISSLGISGRTAGLLGMDFQCHAPTAEPRLQIFWWGDGIPGAKEAASALLSAKDGKLIIPLDAFPRWLALRHAQGLRIDLHNPSACGSVSVEGLWLAQRRSVQGMP